MGISLILGFYNSRPVIAATVARACRLLASLRCDFEILCIDDASTDGGAEVVADLRCEGRQHVRLIVEPRNVGRGATVARGIREARFNTVGFIDVDLEIPIECVLPLVLAIEDDGADVAVGSRVYELVNVYGWIRFFCSRAYRRLVRRVIGVPFDSEAGIKFFRRDRILPILDDVRDNHWFWDTEVVTLAHLRGLRVTERKVLVCRNPAAASTSSVRLLRDGLRHIRRLLALRRRLRRAADAPPAGAAIAPRSRP